MSNQEKNRLEPPANNPITEPYWSGTKDKILLLQRCRSTGKFQFFPRATSIHDLGAEIEWIEASGKGKIYSYSIQYRPANPTMGDKVPYIVALVELEEGIRLMTNIVGCEPDEVNINDPVKLTWEKLSDGRHLPLFELV